MVIANRVRQLFSALTARLGPADIELIENNLNVREKTLFYEMDLPSQKHSLLVATKCRELARELPVDAELLIKTGLLHDVGKKSGDLSILDRCLIVFLNFILPGIIRSKARKGRGNHINNFRHALYIHYNHPMIGAGLLQEINAPDKIVQLVAAHHLSESSGDSMELTILRMADDMY